MASIARWFPCTTYNIYVCIIGTVLEKHAAANFKKGKIRQLLDKSGDLASIRGASIKS